MKNIASNSQIIKKKDLKALLESRNDLDQKLSDFLIDTLRIGIGPLSSYLAGPLLEGFLNCVPSRIDRLTSYLGIITKVLEKVVEDQIVKQFTNNNFRVLFDESTVQAIRSVTDDRLRYLAMIIKEGIDANEQEIYRLRHLLQILSEINDEEILQLMYYWADRFGDADFVANHPETRPQTLTAPGPRVPEETHGAELGNYIFQQSYLNHLNKFGLLNAYYEEEQEIPGIAKYRHRFQEQKVAYYEITTLGILLLTVIGLVTKENGPYGLRHAIKNTEDSWTLDEDDT